MKKTRDIDLPGLLKTGLYILLIAIALVAAIFYFSDTDPRNAGAVVDTVVEELSAKLPPSKALGKPTPAPTPIGDKALTGDVLPQEGKLTLTAIDVGQGDSLLVVTPDGKTMLIDGGEKSEFDAVKGFLDAAGIEKLDVVVATHPHSDHIGSLSQVLQSFNADKIYMPKVTHNTKTYEKLLETIKAQGKKITTAKAGESIKLGDEVSVKILHPGNSTYSDMNDYSVTLRLDYGETSMLLTGDAGFDAEDAMLADYSGELDVDLLKVAHHGSSENTGSKFLNKVNPQYAMISVGEDNSYNHPSAKVIERLEHKDIQIYRTNIYGSVSAYSDGTTITIATQR